MEFEELDSIEAVFQTIEQGDEIIFVNGRGTRNFVVDYKDGNEISIGPVEEGRSLKMEDGTVQYIEIDDDGELNVKEYLKPETLVNYDKKKWCGDESILEKL